MFRKCYILINIPNKRKEYYIKSNFFLNLILILAKFHIHKCKNSKTQPLFLVLEKEMQICIETFHSHSKKAIKTVSVCESFNTFIAFLASSLALCFSMCKCIIVVWTVHWLCSKKSALQNSVIIQVLFAYCFF